MELNKELAIIEHVAVYLRKSRDESNGTEDVLAKHERELVEFCKRNGWKFVTYKEIGSSDTIENRPEMVKLLDDVKAGLFDAVVVMDIDRLGRGNLQDQATIRRIFGDSNTLIVTPQRVYNLADSDQEIILDVESMLARFEYKQIKKRLSRGKKFGAKAGKWTNGKPPFPYFYNREEKCLEVNQEQEQIYQLIKDKFLNDGQSCKQIAVQLNRLGIPSPTGKLWSDNGVHRLLTNEVHLGRITFGKTEGSKHKNRKVAKPFRQLPRDQWTIVENAHPAVKTLEEHVKILDLLERKRIIPTRSRKGEYVLSGLVRCGVCGASMTFLPNTKIGKPSLKHCQHTDAFGNHCDNRGFGDLDGILDLVFSGLSEHEKELEEEKIKTQEPNVNEPLQRALSQKEQELAKLTASLDKIKELYEMGDYSRAEYITKSDKRKREIADKENEVREIRDTLGQVLSVRTIDEQLGRVKYFRKQWQKCSTTQQKNTLLKSVVEKIVYLRQGKEEPSVTTFFY